MINDWFKRKKQSWGIGFLIKACYKKFETSEKLDRWWWYVLLDWKLGEHPLEGLLGQGAVALLCCHIKVLCWQSLRSKGSVCARNVWEVLKYTNLATWSLTDSYQWREKDRDGVTLRQRRARFGESDTDKEKESFTTRREGHKHKVTSVNVMTEAGRITEGDRHMNIAVFIKPELEWLWKLEK